MRGVLVLLLLLVAAPVFAQCSDSMTGSAGTNLTAHTSDSGHSWAKQSGTTSNLILSDANRVRSDAAALITYYCSWDPASADYSVQMLHLAVTASDNYLGVGRAATGDQSKYLCVYDPANTRWALSKHDAAGASTELATWSETLMTLDFRTVKLQMIGSSIKCYIDGVERMSVIDTSHTAAGKAGIFAYGATANATHFHGDNFITADIARQGLLTLGVGD
jgi:hypothetical protein